jgi:hypothetical protein
MKFFSLLKRELIIFEKEVRKLRTEDQVEAK